MRSLERILKRHRSEDTETTPHRSSEDPETTSPPRKRLSGRQAVLAAYYESTLWAERLLDPPEGRRLPVVDLVDLEELGNSAADAVMDTTDLIERCHRQAEERAKWELMRSDAAPKKEALQAKAASR